MIDHPAKVHIPAMLSQASQYAAAVLSRFSGEKLYKVYCADDLCSELDLSGLPLADGNNPLEKAFIEVALDMNISVIHSFVGSYADYSCREEAVWTAVKLLAASKNSENADTVDALFTELRRSFALYLDKAQGDILQAAEPNLFIE